MILKRICAGFPGSSALEANLVAFVVSLWGVAAALNILPERLTPADVLTIVLALTGIGRVVFRKMAKAGIG